MIKKISTEDNRNYKYYDFNNLTKELGYDLNETPFSLRIILENYIRYLISQDLSKELIEKSIHTFFEWNNHFGKNETEIFFCPARVLMQDFTGVPAVVDLATMRDFAKKNGKEVSNVNPKIPVCLVIDHSLQINSYGSEKSLALNLKNEMEQNLERYKFLKWGQSSFDNFSLVPPGFGICHQINLENLASVVFENKDGLVYPDTVVGTDSHTTMINALGVLGWGVGGIEAESVMLGEAISILLPEVVGVKISGSLNYGILATDVVLHITNILRKYGVVNKFVEFFGDGVLNLSMPDRATIANMAPEYGATCGFFAVDKVTLDYLNLTGRSEEKILLTEKYLVDQNLFVNSESYKNVKFTDIIEVNLNEIKPCVAGPKRPQDKLNLDEIPANFLVNFPKKSEAIDSLIQDGDVVLAAITSCTNTSNPAVLIASGLLAKKAYELGLRRNLKVKTSFSPGSRVVASYMENSGLQKYLDNFGFNIVGYGCATCIGNSGPLNDDISQSIQENDISVASVISGNRNFEGRVHPLIKANYLASPPLVVAYSLLGNVNKNINSDSLGSDKNGNPVYLKDIWPSQKEIDSIISSVVDRKLFVEKYNNIKDGDELWRKIPFQEGEIYNWTNNDYIAKPPYFENISSIKTSVNNAKILALFGDSITTDHISPAGDISKKSPAANYLRSVGVAEKDFNSYGSRRGNHEVMMRGTFANIRIKNYAIEVDGPMAKNVNGDITSIYDAAISFKSQGTDLIIFAGKEYGTGSSRDWAAKGTNLLGIKAVIVESFERIHRSNLVGMGVLPLQFKNGESWKSLNLKGDESVDLDLSNISVKGDIVCKITSKNDESKEINLLIRIDTDRELDYYKSGGIMQYVMSKID